MQIKTERLTLRPWQPADSEPFAALNQDSDVAEFFPKILAKKESDDLITKIKNEYAEHGFGLMAVELNSNHKFIGFIGLSIPSFTAIRVIEKIGMKHDKNRDFLHPKLPSNHALAAHVLYCINKKSYDKK